MQVYQTLGEFLGESDVRLRSHEWDFGVHWRDAAGGTWRISWIERTGEIYALRVGPARLGEVRTYPGLTAKQEMIIRTHGGTSSGPVMVLGTLRSRTYLEQAVAGWEEVSDGGSVAWFTERIERWLSHQTGYVRGVMSGDPDNPYGIHPARSSDTGDVGA
jgi:hypothetical protein